MHSDNLKSNIDTWARALEFCEKETKGCNDEEDFIFLRTAAHFCVTLFLKKAVNYKSITNYNKVLHRYILHLEGIQGPDSEMVTFYYQFYIGEELISDYSDQLVQVTEDDS